MTEASEQPGSDIRAGDRVTLRGSDPPKIGRVLTVLYRSADWLPGDFPTGQVPDVPAVVLVERRDRARRRAARQSDQTAVTAERPAWSHRRAATYDEYPIGPCAHGYFRNLAAAGDVFVRLIRRRRAAAEPVAWASGRSRHLSARHLDADAWRAVCHLGRAGHLRLPAQHRSASGHLPRPGLRVLYAA